VLQRRPNTFAQTNLSPHFSLATKRRTIHSGLPVIQEFLRSIHTSRLINTNHLKSRICLCKRQTVSRRSVENKELRELCYAALLF
jgi:hypothetical protein